MTEFAAARHEASHAIAARALGFPVTYITIRQTPDRIGACRLDPTARVLPGRELDFAITLVAGGMGERLSLGRDPWHRVNWFQDDPDSDEDRARDWIHAEIARGLAEDELNVAELNARQWVQLRARVLVFSKWEEVEAVAEKLERETMLMGAEVGRIIQDVQTRRMRERSQRAGLKPISHAEAWERIAAKSRRGALQVAAWKHAAKHGPPMERR
jgi:hypothetical protein